MGLTEYLVFEAPLQDLKDHYRLLDLALPGARQVNFLWAYATLGEPMGAACLAALAAQAQNQLPRFKEQNLSNMAWALATMGAHEPVSG